jgi:N-acetylmuramoyl-L-alanine amidase
MVREGRLELPLCRQSWILSPVRLPIPPLSPNLSSGSARRSLTFNLYPLLNCFRNKLKQLILNQLSVKRFQARRLGKIAAKPINRQAAEPISGQLIRAKLLRMPIRFKHLVSLPIVIALLVGAVWIATPVPVWADPPLNLPGQYFRVALDPGHGGSDLGARGPTGLLEKNVCLALARDLALRLESQYKVILTRSDDYQVELHQRDAIANQADADLLISLHTGASFVHATRGMTVYYYSDADRGAPSDAMDRPVAADDAQQWDLTQNRYQAASLALATALKKRLDKGPESPGCSLRGAPLTVLEGADMPAVLIEIGHITHPATETRLAALKDGGWLAEQIADGIMDFLSQRKGPRSSRIDSHPRLPAWRQRAADPPSG